ncbi:RDD family protein [Paucibacter soli]|uniref:RDD family protein n=1 Tax=Paucibacter soli TaxID=3133433 RepID=UPI0030B5D767
MKPAGLKVRALALAIDALLLYMVLAPLGWLLRGDALGAGPGTLAALTLAGVKWLLPSALVLGFWHACGATPGKLVCALRIVDASSGGRPGVGQLALRWLLWLASALPLGLGLLWTAIHPARRGWHDQFAGTAVVRASGGAGRPEPGMARLRAYLLSHWLGELPLAVSFWLNTVLVALPLLAAALGLAMQVNVHGAMLSLGSAALLAVWALLLLALCWAVPGCWRAASAYARSGPDQRRALAAHAALVVLASAVLLASGFDVLPRAGQYLQLASGSDPLGNAAITLSEDGARLALKGPLGRGDGAEFMRIAADAKRLRVLELASSGGRLAEAQRIADFVRARKLRTRVTGNCDGACALIFLAGAERQIVPAAAVGLSGAASGLLSPLLAGPVAVELASRYRALGLPEPFIARMLQAGPASRWQVPRTQWEDAGLLDAAPATLDVALPAAGAADARFELAEQLRGHPSWYWLNRYLPGLIDAAAERMAATLAQGDDAAQVQAEGQALVTALLPGLLQSAGNELRVAYLAIWSDQLKSARQLGPSQCAALLAGQAAVKRQLDEALIGRENAWLVQAAMQGEGPDFRPVNANEQVVLQHRLGERAPAILAGLFQAGRKAQRRQDCERSIEILALVNALPLNMRQVAARAIFQD